MHDIRTIRALNANFKEKTDKEVAEHFKQRALKAERELNKYRIAELRAGADDVYFRDYFTRDLEEQS